MEKVKNIFKSENLSLKEYSKYVYIIVNMVFVEMLFTIIILRLNLIELPITEQRGIYKDIIIALLVAPILEELFFRKLIFSIVLKNVKYSNIIQAGIFGFLHGGVLRILLAIFDGLIYGNCYRKSANILYPMSLHFVWNGIGLLISGLLVMLANKNIFDIMSISIIYLISIFVIILLNTIYFVIKNKSLELFKL